MTKGEESILNKMDKQLAVLNSNFDNHLKSDEKHRDYMRKKMDIVVERVNKIDDKLVDFNIAINGTKVEDYKDGLVAKVNAHGEYHEENEEKWGLQAYLRSHLKVFVVLIVLGILALGYVGINIETIAQAGLKSIGVKIDLPVKE